MDWRKPQKTPVRKAGIPARSEPCTSRIQSQKSTCGTSESAEFAQHKSSTTHKSWFPRKYLRHVPASYIGTRAQFSAGPSHIESLLSAQTRLSNISSAAQRQRSCLRHYATSRNAAGSLPEEVSGCFNSPNPSSALWPWGRLSPWQKWVLLVPRNFSRGSGVIPSLAERGEQS
jgi:hypothetical protein